MVKICVWDSFSLRPKCISVGSTTIWGCEITWALKGMERFGSLLASLVTRNVASKIPSISAEKLTEPTWAILGSRTKGVGKDTSKGTSDESSLNKETSVTVVFAFPVLLRINSIFWVSLLPISPNSIEDGLAEIRFSLGGSLERALRTFNLPPVTHFSARVSSGSVLSSKASFTWADCHCGFAARSRA